MTQRTAKARNTSRKGKYLRELFKPYVPAPCVLFDVLFGKIADDGQFEHLSLVGLHHQDDPNDQHDDVDDRKHDGEDDHDGKGDLHREEPAEGYDRLHGVESDEFIVFLEDEKYDAG